MAKQGKRLNEAWSMLEAGRLYSLEEAVGLLANLPAAKFDESVDMAVQLGVDPRKAEENVRGTVSLPHGTGKSVRILVFATGPAAEAATAALRFVVAVRFLVVVGSKVQCDAVVIFVVVVRCGIVVTWARTATAAATAGTHEAERVQIKRQRLFEIDNVDLVAFTEDERRHLGIPKAGLVPKVHARLQHLTHGNVRHFVTSG